MEITAGKANASLLTFCVTDHYLVGPLLISIAWTSSRLLCDAVRQGSVCVSVSKIHFREFARNLVFGKHCSSFLTHCTFRFPYRIVFAVATQDSIIFYDTQQQTPFAYISDIHYSRLSDVTWSKDGRLLMVSSTDGYCTFVTFDEGEIGMPYEGPVYVAAPVAASPPRKPPVQSAKPQNQSPLLTLWKNCPGSKNATHVSTLQR